MGDKIRPDLLVQVRQRLAKKGITADSDFSRFPVAPVCVDEVPFVGNVHIPAGRIAKRSEIDRRFKA